MEHRRLLSALLLIFIYSSLFTIGILYLMRIDHQNEKYRLIQCFLMFDQELEKTSTSFQKLFKFKKIHDEIMQGKRALKVSINGFTDGGYANKLYSMLSSLIVAIITDSAFIVNWHNISLYIREPLNGKHII